MYVDELRARYGNLVVTACEWRAMDLAEPRAMADEVFARLQPARDHSLRDLYGAIDKVVLATYQRHSDSMTVLDKLRSGAARRPERGPDDDYRDALSSLREGDRRLLQLRFWDELDEEETREVLGLSVEGVRERTDRAGKRYLAKVSRRHPEVTLGDVVSLLEGLKPGHHHRFGR